MSLALDDLPRDPEWLLRQLQQMAEVVASERSRNTALEIERDTVLSERDPFAPSMMRRKPRSRSYGC
jgi:hypothetical protein